MTRPHDMTKKTLQAAVRTHPQPVEIMRFSCPKNLWGVHWRTRVLHWRTWGHILCLREPGGVGDTVLTSRGPDAPTPRRPDAPKDAYSSAMRP